MNKDNLEQLIHNYMEKYDLLNDAEHDEIYKMECRQSLSEILGFGY